MSLELILLQAAGQGAGMTNLLFFGLMILVMWFFFFRPQMKKQREQNKFGEALEKGDEVVTSSGILGKINKIEGNIITLEVGTKTYIRITKGAISKEMTDAVFAADDKDKK